MLARINKEVDVSTHPLFLCPYPTKKQMKLEESFRKTRRKFQKFQKKFQTHFNYSDGVHPHYTFAPVITTTVVAGVFVYRPERCFLFSINSHIKKRKL